MACDKPIVASNIGGISNIIKENINGFLVGVEDSDNLANKVEELIKHKSKQRYFIENNKKHRKKYDIKYVIDKHIKLIEEK